MTSQISRQAGIYPGWIVLAGSFLSALLIIGGSIYIYQLLVLPVTQEFGITRGEASYAFIALLVGIGVWSPLLGRLYDHLSVKLLMPLGGLAYAAGLTIVSAATSPTVILLAIALCLGPAMVLAGGLAANTLAARWFDRRRGRALGMASIASSAGGFIIVPLATALIASYDWRSALLMLGIGIGVVVVCLGLFIVRDRPTAQQLEQFGENSPELADTLPEQGNWTFKSLLVSANFWLIVAGVGLLLASDQAILTSQYPYLVDIGFSAVEAATVISAMTGSAIAGKLLVGWLAERYDIRWLYVLVALFHIALLLIFLVKPGFVAMLVFASIFGAAVGGIYPVWSVLVSKAFGTASFGTAFGGMALFTQVLAIGFVAFIGSSYDNTGSYRFAFICFLGAIILGIISIALVRINAAEEADQP